MLFLHKNLYHKVDRDCLKWGSDINLAYQDLLFLFLNPFLIAANPQSVAACCIFH